MSSYDNQTASSSGYQRDSDPSTNSSPVDNSVEDLDKSNELDTTVSTSISSP